MAAANPARTNPTLVDTKGLGKLPPFKNTESEFVSWARRTENFVASVHPGCLDVGRGKRIGNSGRSEYSNRSCNASGHSANAGRSIVHGADFFCGNRIVGHLCGLWIWRSLEAWRRLHKRWDPLTTGRARGLPREILSPGRAKLVELQGAVERLED